MLCAKRLTRGGEKEKIREAVRLAVRRTATEWTGKKPIVDVMLLQIG
jgi:ribonuclease J